MVKTKGKRTVILSFDGLSSNQFERILPLMPKLQQRAKELQCADLDSTPFVSAQPIWAQILTGQPWFRNGCTAYAQPRGSLNRLQVATERDLLTPMLPMFTERPGAAINLPLMLPRENVSWLSDGSMPVQQKVMPQSLADSEPFRRYEPRGYIYLPVARVMNKLAVANCFSVERIRLECAETLAKDEKNEWIALRLSLFDELSHFFGHQWLDEPDLWVHPHLEEFLAFADDKLDAVCRDSIVVMWSSFSHSTCHSTINLNLMLRDLGYLRLHGNEEQLAPARAEARRAEALEAISGSGLGTKKNKLQSVEGLILTERSNAASPTSGCIYINDDKRFFDGCVPSADRAKLKSVLVSRLQQYSEARSPNSVKFFPAPDDVETPVPDCIVFAANAELTDALNLNVTPPTTHSPVGFVFAPGAALRNFSTIRPMDLGQMIGEFR